jgi:hypothetical protein
VELINSLIVEPGHLHVRRVFVSLAVYAVLMLLLILVPLVQLVLTCRFLGVSPYFQFRHWYVIPEVQIPLELFVVHVCFLSVLDTRKDVIGRAQHHVLLFLTEQLGLKMMLIPHATETNGALGAPLRRPPPGWDLRTPNQSVRSLVWFSAAASNACVDILSRYAVVSCIQYLGREFILSACLVCHFCRRAGRGALRSPPQWKETSHPAPCPPTGCPAWSRWC